MIERRFEDGVYLRLVKAEKPAGTLIYIHGLGDSGLGFERLISDRRLADWTHVVPDLPGYGKSDWPDRPMPLHEHAALIAAMIAGRRIAPAVVLGHSMGGVIGLMLCEQHPELVQAFINVEGNISLDDCIFSGKAIAYRQEEFLTAGRAALLDEICRAGVTDLPLRTYYASMQMCDARAIYLNSGELVTLSSPEKLARRLAALEIRQLYLAGHPRGSGRRSGQLLDEAKVPWEAVENAGHWPFIDQPDDFIQRVLRFLGETSGTP